MSLTIGFAVVTTLSWTLVKPTPSYYSIRLFVIQGRSFPLQMRWNTHLFIRYLFLSLCLYHRLRKWQVNCKAMRFMAQGHMSGESWSELCVPDQIMAHMHAFPHEFLKARDMPSYLKDMFKWHSSGESSLITRECAFEANIILTTATWKFVKVVEDFVISLEPRMTSISPPSICFLY